MADEKVDASKIDPEDIIDAEYDDIPEEQHQAFEAQIKHEQEKSMRRFLSCFERTQQGVVQKEEFVLPPSPFIRHTRISRFKHLYL